MAVRRVCVKATKKGFGGVPVGRRIPGEVFSVMTREDGTLPPSSWYVEVPAGTPASKPPREPAKAPEYTKFRGEYVPVEQRSVSGGGPSIQPAPDIRTGEDLV